MGMCAVFVSASDETIAAILQNPNLIFGLTHPDIDPKLIMGDMQPSKSDAPKKKSRGMFRRLFKGFAPQEDVNTAEDEPPIPERLHLSDKEGREIDLDKAWHGLHYCLTGEVGGEDAPHPLGFIGYGGHPAGDVDLGYGPARMFTAAQTRELQNKLSELTFDDLRAVYNPDKMEHVYPDIWSREDEDNFEYITMYFEVLREFLKECAENKIGFVTHIS